MHVSSSSWSLAHLSPAGYLNQFLASVHCFFVIADYNCCLDHLPSDSTTRARDHQQTIKMVPKIPFNLHS